ncbi:MAG: hypothetical protein WCI37_01680 [bacterium]
MYGSIIPVTATTAGVAGVALLPDTGSFKVMFYVAAVVMTVGLITLIATGAVKFKKSFTK